MEIAVILPVHNHLEYTKITLKEISQQFNRIRDLVFHLILIDDGSLDGTYDWVRLNYPEVVVLTGDGNLWWSGAVNMGAHYAFEKLNADYIILWNNDIHIEEDYFQRLLKILSENEQTVIFGSKIYVAEQPRLVWSMGGYFNPKSGKYGMYGYYEEDSVKYGEPAPVDWLTGMGTIIPRKVVERTGYWDNINFPMYHGDSDFTYRAKKNGFNVIVHPSLKIYNSVKNSGIEHEGNLKKLFQLVTDIRSKSNFKKLFRFYRMYAESPRAYFPLIWFYFQLFGGFFKWKILAILNLRRNKIHSA